MALRVLLADESSTIKKVFQLALQDFAVEVRPVNIGVDVAMVAKVFKPDIIFADVMLQKKNGYDVCAELKQDASLKGIPFVLMWSGFMELDEDKFQASHANASLEKPFDVAALRKLVSDLVPRTHSQSLSQYLTFPKGTVEAEKRPAMIEDEAPAPAEEEFVQVPMPKLKNSQSEKYRLNLRPEELDPGQFPVDFAAPATTGASTLDAGEPEPEQFSMREVKKSAAPASTPTARTAPESSAFAGEVDLDDESVAEFTPKEAGRAPAAPATKTAPGHPIPGILSADQLEKIIREQSAEVIESVVWKVIPELATQIIERELQKLLKERDSQQY